MPRSFHRFSGTSTYLTNEPLEAAVDCALVLDRPLLVKGEPGTGKTQLAQAIAESLALEWIRWPIKSVTRAQDGLNACETAERPHEAHFCRANAEEIHGQAKVGPLGRAFASPRRAVLLIDEIDKADSAFPDDLLREIDRMRFVVSETGTEVIATEKPVVVITSNDEKELSDAFLRRCVFHFLAFPDPEHMKRIVRVHHPHVEDALVDQAVTVFYELRAVPRLRKRPSTSELIDWITVLLHAGVGRDRLVRETPFLGVLLKNAHDIDLVHGQSSRPGARR
ncbi:MAG: MoxR family ATPase [Polyangiaceae bacterium]